MQHLEYPPFTIDVKKMIFLTDIISPHDVCHKIAMPLRIFL